MEKQLNERLASNLKGASASTIDALARRLWRLPREHAVVAVDLAVGLGSVSLRVALECLRAAPDVARRVDVDTLRVWGDIGKRLAATSPDAAHDFFGVSAVTLEAIPAEKRSIVLQLVSRQAALSSRVALQAFRFAPQFIAAVDDPRLASDLLAISLELSRHSVKHSWELLEQAPRVLASLRGSDPGTLLVHRAVALTSAFAHRSGGAAADFFARLPDALAGPPSPALDHLLDETQVYLDRSGGVALQYFTAGSAVLRLAGSKAFVQWADLSRRVALQGNAASYHFLKYSPAVVGELARRERERGQPLIREVLAIVQTIGERNPQAAIECFRAAPRALGAASIEQFQRWAERGLELADESARKLQAYYNLESRGSRESLRQADGGLPLERVATTLRLYIEALTGRELRVAAVHGVPEQSSIGDGTTVHLPSVVTLFGDDEDNFRLFKVLAAHGAGQIEFGTYDRNTSELGAAFAAIEERYRAPGAPRVRPPRELGYPAVMRLFPNGAFARHIFTTIENARVDARLRAAYRGIRRDLDFVRDRVFAGRPAVASLPPEQALYELLLRAALGGGVPPEERAGYDRLVAGIEEVLAEYVFRPGAGVADALAATARLYDALVSPESFDSVDSAAEELAEEEGSDDVLPSQQDDLQPGDRRSRAEALPAPEQVPHWTQSDAEVTETAEAAYSSSTDAPEHELESGDVAYFYDEWDRELGDHRAGWCRIIERRGAKGSRSFVELVRSRYSGAISSIRYQFQLMRPESLRRVRGEIDGDDYDLQAVIDNTIHRRATGRTSDRLYVRTLRRRRDVAVAFLLDMSSSTARTISRHPNQPYSNPGRRIIDIEKEGLVLMSEALEAVGDVYAMHGFSSEGRRNVRFFVFKDFGESSSSEVERRIGGISYLNNTRLGTAIRHSAAKLAAQEARTKLLIVLSDGRPYDHDYGDSRYARDDTKMALRQAKRDGIIPFCITIDRESEEQLKDMYGEVGYTIIDDVLSLPERMPAIYRRLTT